MTTPPDLSVIKAAAGAATPGPWKHYKGTTINAVMCGDSNAEIVHWTGFDASHITSQRERRANARYIALMSPSTTEALIARVEAAEGERDKWHDVAMRAGVVVCADGSLIYAKAERLQAAEARVEKLEGALRAIDAIEVLEINPSNYTHEDVCELNANAVQASLIVREALTPTGGQ